MSTSENLDSERQSVGRATERLRELEQRLRGAKLGNTIWMSWADAITVEHRFDYWVHALNCRCRGARERERFWTPAVEVDGTGCVCHEEVRSEVIRLGFGKHGRSDGRLLIERTWSARPSSISTLR